MVNNHYTYSPETLMNLLSEIPDPEIPVINIFELGMLRQVKMVDGKYLVTITPTYTACPAMKMVEDQIHALCARHGIHNIRVELTYTPAWTTDWISPAAKQKLQNYGIAPPRNTACGTVFSDQHISCPKCASRNTQLISRFGSTACKSLHKCNDCLEPFEYFKCH